MSDVSVFQRCIQRHHNYDAFELVAALEEVALFELVAAFEEVALFELVAALEEVVLFELAAVLAALEEVVLFELAAVLPAAVEDVVAALLVVALEDVVAAPPQAVIDKAAIAASPNTPIFFIMFLYCIVESPFLFTADFRKFLFLMEKTIQ